MQPHSMSSRRVLTRFLLPPDRLRGTRVPDVSTARTPPGYQSSGLGVAEASDAAKVPKTAGDRPLRFVEQLNICHEPNNRTGH